MNVSVRGRHLDVSHPLRVYAGRRLQFAIGSFEPRIDQVEVRIEDVNGPRGGIDKTATITVFVNPGGWIFARAAGTNAYSAVDRAASRIRTLLVRRVRSETASRRPDRRAAAPQTPA
jgi:ribosome-associated translation inhibitor RaiA